MTTATITGMTDEQQTPDTTDDRLDNAPPPDSDDAKEKYEDHLWPDWVLEGLVSLVNRTGTRMSVTLNIGGVTIGGLLCSIEDYFNRLADQLDAVAGDQHSQSAGSALASVYRKKAQDFKADPDAPREPRGPHYIHLLDAVELHGPARYNHPSWRGRMIEVDGWSIGAVTNYDES